MSNYTDRDDKERIRQALSVEQVLGNYLELRRQGSSYVALCPWHDDTRPSLQVNPARQSWKCWVCDLGGDIFSFIMKREAVQFPEALRILADMAGIQLARRTGPKTRAGDANDKPTLYRAMAWAEQQYHEFLKHSPEAGSARRYLAERGIQEAAIDAFKIGFAPNQFSWILDRSKSTEFSEQVLQAIGLVKSSDKSSGFYDRFRGRILFPIRDSNNRPIAVGGRVLPEVADEHEQKYGDPPAKYINSPETRLFSKSEHLYGLNLMRDAIAKARHLVVVEGYTDVIAAWQAGLDNVVAVLGTALGSRHLRLIRRFADQVTLVLDGDQAGQRRANEVLELFIAADLDLRILTLPEATDPCDFLSAQGAHEFRQLVEGAADALDHKIAIETEAIDPLRDTHRAHQALENILSTIANSPRPMSSRMQTNLREQQLLARLARVFSVDIEQVRRRLIERRARRHSAGGAEGSAGTVKKLKLTSKDCELLQIILERPEIFPNVFEILTIDQLLQQFAHPATQYIFRAMNDLHDAGESPSFERLMTAIDDPELKSALNRLDEAAQAKAESSTIDASERLRQNLQAFERTLQQSDQRNAISELQADASDEDQEAIFKRLMEQALQRQGYTAPTDG